MMQPSPTSPDLSAKAVLDIAAEVEAAEARIKQAILDAARAGDCAMVSAIMLRWVSLPAAEVLPLPAPTP